MEAFWWLFAIVLMALGLIGTVIPIVPGTTIILAAAVLKLPDLAGHQGNGVRGPALVGALCSAFTAYLAVRFLMRYFETRTLTPFAIYCACAGTSAAIYFAV